MLVFILFLVFVLLVTILAKARWRFVERYVKYCSDKVVAVGPAGVRYQFSNFSGLGDEPLWTGCLPCSVDDFVEPRYVYEDLFESETPVKDHGRVIGYRISPTLVIHSMVGGNHCWGCDAAYAFATTYRGHFLEREDVNILRQNWSKVSQMREDIGDEALPTAWFWAKEDGMKMVPAHYRSRRWFTPEKCNVIMKR